MTATEKLIRIHELTNNPILDPTPIATLCKIVDLAREEHQSEPFETPVARMPVQQQYQLPATSADYIANGILGPPPAALYARVGTPKQIDTGAPSALNAHFNEGLVRELPAPEMMLSEEQAKLLIGDKEYDRILATLQPGDKLAPMTISISG